METINLRYFVGISLLSMYIITYISDGKPVNSKSNSSTGNALNSAPQNNAPQGPVPLPNNIPVEPDVKVRNKDDPRPGDERDSDKQEDAGAGHGINDDTHAQQHQKFLSPERKEEVSHEDTLKFAKMQEKLKVDDLKPPDHLDAVKLEQDGHLNKDYLKEIFIGNHEELEKESEEDQEKKLADIFYKVDTDDDDFVVQNELEEWIKQKIQEHFDEATEENQKVFSILDTDKNGFVTWKEFVKHFLIAKGLNPNKAGEVPDVAVMDLGTKENEDLNRFKYHWEEADGEPEDHVLSLEEFRAFRHPEQSKIMMHRMVKDILDNLDKDQNGVLTEEEFVALPPGEVDDDGQASDRRWQEERRKEFRSDIDHDNDGKVTKAELLEYVDPKNPNVSKSEAKNLLSMADNNKDGKLSLEEVLYNKAVFLESKVVNTGWSFHSEL